MKSKRILSLVLAMIMVLGTFGTVFAEEPEATTYGEKIQWLIDQGIVVGNETGDYMLGQNIDRASVAKMVVHALDKTQVAEGLRNYKAPFVDVPVNHWSNGNINVVSAEGLMIGNLKSQFMPSAEISYAEVLTVLVRIVMGEDLVNPVWPTSYIAKAYELGIMEGVAAPASFMEHAKRETILEMFYNAMIEMEVGNYYIVKAIVLENSRVEKLAKDEVVVEIIREMQVADFADKSRKEKGDQERFVIDPKVGDVENLLGKVADFAINKDGKVVKVTEDETYKVEIGAFKATKNKMGSYTVELDERYKDTDERVFRTYYNNKPFAYEDFYSQDRDKRSEFNVEYAKVTVKNGKVLFIDAFNFDDVAPVKEVKADGAEVYVYNDARDGSVKRYNLGASATVLLVEDNVIRLGSREDIRANDVIHEYDGGYIVKKDAAINGKFEKVSEARNGDVFVHVDGKEYLVDTADLRKPVYSFETNDDFFTLNARYAHSELSEFRDENVTIMIDLAGNLQFIGSEIELGEFVGLVTRVVGRDVRILKNDGKTYDYYVTLNTRVSGTTGHTTLNDLRPGHLVFVRATEDAIDRLDNLNEPSRAVEALDTRDIKLAGEDNYRILSETNIFVAQDGVFEVRTAKDVADAFKKNDDAEAFVLDGEEFAKVTRRSNLAPRGTEAHTIVFTKIELERKSDKEIVEFNGYADRQETEMRIILEDGTRETRAVKGEMPKFNGGDIIEITVSKDDNKDILEAELLIANNKDDVWGVEEYDRYRNLKLVDAKGGKLELYVTNSTKIFGNLSGAKRVKVVTESASSKYVKAILVMGDRDRITANIGAPVTRGMVTYVDSRRVEVDGTRYDLDVNSRLVDVNGRTLAYGELIKDHLTRGDYVKVPVDVKDGVVVLLEKTVAGVPAPDKTALNLAKNAAAALNKNDYTAASWADLQDALALPETTKAQVDAKTDAINDAIDALVGATPGTGITATYTETSALGVAKVVITVNNADAADVEKVLINGSEVTIQRKVNKEVTILSAEAVTKVEIVVAGTTYTVTK